MTISSCCSWGWSVCLIASAQVIPDNSLPSNSIVNFEGETQRINGGTEAGSNLFHSFEQFDVPSNSIAHFDNAPAIVNIFSRVTGGKFSSIDGLIQANGSASLFLINPKGIIFGPNSKLDIGGAFIATTANGVLFDGERIFSANPEKNSSSPPLLSVNIPIGLAFNRDSGSIINQSEAGLTVKPGRTLGLIGGEVKLEGGNLTSPSGRIELGAVGTSSQVSLTQPHNNPQTLSLNYNDVNNFQDIEISNLAIVDTSGNSSGGVQIQGRRVTLKEGGRVQTKNLGANDGGDLVVNATESLELLGNTSSDSPLDEDFAVNGFFVPQKTTLVTRNFGTGQSGSIIINAGQLGLTNGAEIFSNAEGLGKGGDIIINSIGSISVVGETSLLGVSSDFPVDNPIIRNFTIDQAITSRITAGTSLLFDSGQGGNISITTNNLTLLNGGHVDTGSNLGRGGNLTIFASDTVEIVGSTKRKFAASNVNTATSGFFAGSDTSIEAKRIILSDGGFISATTFASGQGGDIFIKASESLEISGGIPDNELLKSQINTGTFGSGDAGNIDIDTNKLIVRDGALVVANSLASAEAGSLEILANSILLEDEATVTVSSPQGQAGNLTINTNYLSLTQGSITAETGKSEGEEGANIILNVSDLFRIENESLISAQAFDTANGGNVDINTKFLIAFPSESLNGSDIIANASEGIGGNIKVTAQGIFGIEQREASEGNRTNDIDASSEFGLDGVVEINQPDLDPDQGLIELPETVVDPNALISQNPCKRDSESEFIISGKGGLPPSIGEDISSDATQVGLVEPAPMVAEEQKSRETEDKISSPPSETDPIIPAQGWVFNEGGEVVLVGYNPAMEAPRQKDKSAGCHSPY